MTTANERIATGTPTVPWRGFHHIALVTPDLDATIAFYRDVLGMTAGDVATRGGGRHCFITPGEGEAWGLHFFEYPDAELMTSPEQAAAFFANPETMRFGFLPGALQHIALALPDEAAALTLRDRLTAANVPVSPIYGFGAIRNFMLADNNGLFIEAAWPVPADRAKFPGGA